MRTETWTCEVRACDAKNGCNPCLESILTWALPIFDCSIISFASIEQPLTFVKAIKTRIWRIFPSAFIPATTISATAFFVIFVTRTWTLSSKSYIFKTRYRSLCFPTGIWLSCKNRTFQNFEQCYLLSLNQRPDQYKMKIHTSIQYDFQILKYQFQYSIWRILNKYQYSVSVSFLEKSMKKQANQADLKNWSKLKFLLNRH